MTQNNKNFLVALAASLASLASLAFPLQALGIQTADGYVRILGVSVGETWLVSAQSDSWAVLNSADQSALVALEIIEPGPAERLRDGYEKLPDAAWRRALPRTVELPPRSSRRGDLYVRLPERAQYAARRYQAFFQARVLGAEGSSFDIAVAVKVPLLIEADARAGGPLFEFFPSRIECSLKRGKRTRLSRLAKEPVRLHNKGPQQAAWSFRFLPELFDENGEIFPDSSWTFVKATPLTVLPGRKKSVSGWIEIPVGAIPGRYSVILEARIAGARAGPVAHLPVSVEVL